MDSRTLRVLTLVVICGVGVIFLLNVRNMLFQETQPTFVAQDNVRGMAIIHKKKPYTLNFDQQKKIIDILNQALPVKGVSSELSQESPDFEKISIYLFKGNEVEIIPLAWSDNSLVFSAPAWQHQGYLREMSGGKLYTLLETSYDP